MTLRVSTGEQSPAEPRTALEMDDKEWKSKRKTKGRKSHEQQRREGKRPREQRSQTGREGVPMDDSCPSSECSRGHSNWQELPSWEHTEPSQKTTVHSPPLSQVQAMDQEVETWGLSEMERTPWGIRGCQWWIGFLLGGGNGPELGRTFTLWAPRHSWAAASL